MKILTISNLYPPYVIGGYEALCQEAVDWLRARGHTVHVLTSTYGVDRPVTEGHIHRLLTLESNMDGFALWRTLSYRADSVRNDQCLLRLIADLQPDLVFVWGMWLLSRSLLRAAEASSSPPIVYYFASPWPLEPTALAAYWDTPAQHPLRQLIKVPAAKIVRSVFGDLWGPAHLRFEYPVCNTISLRDQLVEAGYNVGDAAIVCEGIDLAPYRQMRVAARTVSDPLRLVFVGRLGWHKGPHTIVEAMADLVNRRHRRNIELTICGGGLPDYKQHLQDLVRSNHLEAYVHFQKPFPREELPHFLGQHHALVLSSIWEEALARIMQEALAACRVVIGTTTGATKEFIFDGETGLTFPPGDTTCLADQIERLADDPQLGERVSKAGQELAFQQFDMHRMSAEIERYLECVASVRMPTAVYC